jgi:glycosyltransferase involved in cell wall biosynthesis
MPEKVGDGGMLVDPKSPVEIASTIYTIASDEPFRQSLFKKYHEVIGPYVQEKFDKTFMEVINII